MSQDPSNPAAAAAAYYHHDADTGVPTATQHNKWSKNGYGNPVRKQTGKFSPEETEIVRKSVKEFCAAKQISTARLCSECDHKAELKGAWMEIAKALPHRSVQSVYRHGIRQLHPFKRGAWNHEEVAALVDLVARLGKKWSAIQGKLHRSADSCRDKYREMSEEYTKGRWKEQETETLKRLIREHVGITDPNMPMVAVGKYVEERGIQIPWSNISKRMVKRSRLSCFKKWQKLTGLFPDDGTKKYKVDDDHDDDDDVKVGVAGLEEEDDGLHHLHHHGHHHQHPHDDDDDDVDGLGLPVAKRAKLDETAFGQAPTAGAAAALAAANNAGYYELYDSAKMADATVEAVGLPDTDSLVPSSPSKTSRI